MKKCKTISFFTILFFALVQLFRPFVPTSIEVKAGTFSNTQKTAFEHSAKYEHAFSAVPYYMPDDKEGHLDRYYYKNKPLHLLRVDTYTPFEPTRTKNTLFFINYVTDPFNGKYTVSIGHEYFNNYDMSESFSDEFFLNRNDPLLIDMQNNPVSNVVFTIKFSPYVNFIEEEDGQYYRFFVAGGIEDYNHASYDSSNRIFTVNYNDFYTFQTRYEYYLTLKDEYKDGREYPIAESMTVSFNYNGTSYQYPMESPIVKYLPPSGPSSDPIVIPAPDVKPPEDSKPGTTETPTQPDSSSPVSEKTTDNTIETEDNTNDSPVIEETDNSDNSLPTFSIENVPDPSNPDSPDLILVVDEDGTPKVYKKIMTEDQKEIYVDENEVPLIGIDTALPKTGSLSFESRLILNLSVIALIALPVSLKGSLSKGCFNRKK